MLDKLRTLLGNAILPPGAKIEKSYIPASGAHVLREFSPPTAPQVVDYPKARYTAYWEFVVQDIPGGHTVSLRYYGYNGQGVLEERQFTGHSIPELRDQVS